MKAEESSSKKKILIVDDHSIVRRGIKAIIESVEDWMVVMQFDTAEKLLKDLEDLDVDLMVVDISLPGMNGIELVKHVLFQKPHQKILMLTRHEDFIYAERALRAGAKGYLTKMDSPDLLLKAIHKILKGGLFVNEEISEKLLQSNLQGKTSPVSSPFEVLSDREMEVFEGIGNGLSNIEIARLLHLAPKTIETYRSRIKDKMNYKNSTELMFNAVKWVESEF